VDPRIQVVKRTNGHDNDADFKLAIGSTVTWTYTVSNPGNVPLRNVRVTDDNGTPDFFADDFSPVFVSGDTNSDGLLDPGEVWVYMATGVAIAGQYSNLGTVKGTDDTGTVPTPVENSDADYYFGRKESPAIVVGPDKSPSTPQEVAVVASDTGKVVTRFAAYENDYVGGTRVAVADLDGDGTDEIITAPGRSRAPEVRVFTMQGDAVPGFPAFFGNSPTFRGGIHLAAADVNGDGKPDIITVPSYGAVEVRVFLNRYPQSPAFVDVADISFLAFPTASIGGGVVHAGDMGRLVNGSFVNLPDKKAEIVVATGGGTKAAVTVFDVSEATPTRVQTFYPFTAVSNNFQGGVSLEVARVDADGVPDIIAGMGANGSSRIEVWAWSASETSLDMLGAIPNAFEGPSSTAPVKMGVADSNGDGIADSLFAVQGPDGTTGEIHRFKINGTASFLYQQIPSLTDFPGSWFIATSETATAEAVWTNPLNPFDVDNDGRVIPLDVLETVNYINTHPGETALPAKQFSPPRFFDTNADRAITPGDVLVVLNYLNDSEVSAGEGEASEPPEEFRAMPSPLGFDVGLAARPDVSSASDGRPDRALAVVRTTTVPGAEWTRPGPGSPLVLHSSKPQFEDPNLSELESVLEVIAPEIAAGYW
ncbi:MAG TPA: FG-GAP-like repeat-containing protein, partial [Candidatus Anammoximicrobium sp.]|nr:FG-GAP-like repeat-containing protein [Candidatus Anammoximicrobium sp.]